MKKMTLKQMMTQVQLETDFLKYYYGEYKSYDEMLLNQLNNFNKIDLNDFKKEINKEVRKHPSNPVFSNVKRIIIEHDRKCNRS